METTILENYLKRTDEMLGTIFGLMGRIDEKIDDLDERLTNFEKNSGSRPPFSEVGPTISDQEDTEITRTFQSRIPGNLIEYLTAPDEVYKEDPLPITHEVVCYHLYSNLHLTL